MTRTVDRVRLAARWVGPAEPVFIVAEIGKNHDGRIGQARQMIDAAAEAGVDAVKIQTHMADEEMLPESPTPSHFPEPRFQFIKRMELSLEAHLELKRHAESKGLTFFSTPFSAKAADLLEELGVAFFKLGSGDVTDLPFLRHVAKKGKPVVLSTGMSALQEVAEAMEVFAAECVPVVLMQCTSRYPAPYEAVNLRAIETLRARFGVPVGLSDHTPTVFTAIAAVALGVCMIEKHFTLSRKLYGPDHAASLEPGDLAQMVEGVRAVEKAIGSGEKLGLPADSGLRLTFQKSVVTVQDLPAGTRIEPRMVATKRPGTGLAPKLLPSVIGRMTRCDIPAGALVRLEDLE